MSDGELSPGDRRLLEHVLDGQRALQVSVSQLHLIVAEYHAEAKHGNEAVGIAVRHLVERCEGIEQEAEDSQESTAQELAKLKERADATEKRLLVALTACSVAWVIGGLLAKYGDKILRVLG